MTQQVQGSSTAVHGSQHHAKLWLELRQNQDKAKRDVNKLQLQIYQATQDEDFKKVTRLQKLLIKSLPARYLAVWRVTSNQGRFTPGTDNYVITTAEQKGKLVEELRNTKIYRAEPIRTVYIPKKDGSKRRLGIPTIKDRAMQALILLALESEC